MTESDNKTRKLRPLLCINLLATFSKKEIENLTALISCHYFNTDKHVIKLLEVLKKTVLHKQTHTERVECSVFQKVFNELPRPKHTLDIKQKRLLNVKMNALLRLAEQFLSIEAIRTNDIHKCELLYPTLINRDQYLLFNRHITKDKKQLNKKVVKGREEYLQSQRIEETILDYLNRTERLIKEDNLSDLTYNLDLSYLLNRLNIHVIALSRKRISPKKENDFSSIEKLNELMELSQYAKHPLIILYRSSIQLIETQDDEAYSCLVDLLEEYSDITPREMLKIFFEVAINFCVAKIWTDREHYLQKMFNLYNAMHLKNLLIENGFIAVNWLKNMIGVGCFAREFEWAEKMIQYYRPYINKEVRDSVCHFNYGAIAFHQKDYETAHSKFILVDKVNLNYDINARVLILKCLYEMEKEYNEYTMTAFRSIDSFFKLNKELPQNSKKGYQNFIKTLRALYRIRYGVGSRTREWVKEQLKRQTVNSDKNWLLEKIEELKNKKKQSY